MGVGGAVEEARAPAMEVGGGEGHVDVRRLHILEKREMRGRWREMEKRKGGLRERDRERETKVNTEKKKMLKKERS